MDEWLAIRIGKVGKWLDLKPDEVQCAKDLKPRAGEDKKSAWAYGHQEETIVNWPQVFLRAAIVVAGRLPRGETLAQRGLLLGRPQAICTLQAVAMLLHAQTAQMAQTARASVSEVCVLSIKRAVIDPTKIEEDSNEHIIPAYDPTHRSLDTKADQDAKAIIKAVSGGDFPRVRTVRTYSVDELKPLLGELLQADLIRARYVPAARAILADV